MANISTTTTITCTGTASEQLQFQVAGTRFVDVEIHTNDGKVVTARVASSDLVHAFRSMENALVREMENAKLSEQPSTVTLRTYRD